MVSIEGVYMYVAGYMTRYNKVQIDHVHGITFNLFIRKTFDTKEREMDCAKCSSVAP